MAKKVVTKELLEKSTQDILQSVVEHLYDFESYTDDEISALFSLTPEEAQRISDIISDNVISQYKLWSSKKTSDAISEAQIECNNYASELISNISSIKLEWCETALPSTGESNKIYILPVTSGSDTVNTLNLWDSTNSNWVVIGNLEIDLTQYYTKTEIDSKLDEKANKTEILSQDDVLSTPDSATTANVLSAKTTVDELNNKLSVDKLSTVVDNLSTNDTVPTSKAVYDYIGTLNSLTGDIDFGNYNLSSDISTIKVGDVIPFEKIDGTINISSGIATLQKGKSYLVSSVINVTADTSAFYDSYLSYALYLNNVEDSFLGITRPSISTGSISDSQITRVIKSDEDVELSVKIVDCDKVTNINKEYTKLSIIEIPNPTSIMNVTDDHINEVANSDRNIKTYTSVEQLGLASGCTVEDIYLALPDNSYFECGANTTAISNLYVINNLPNQKGGLLTIRKYNSTRNDIQYRTTNGNGVMTNLYIAEFKGIDTSNLTWSRVCTTKVDDVALTYITFSNVTNYNMNVNGIHSHYRVKNGICYIDLDVLCVTPKSGWTYINTGSPVPLREDGKSVYFTMGGEDGKSNINGVVDNVGRIGLQFGTSNVRYVTSLSYPVAE